MGGTDVHVALTDHPLRKRKQAHFSTNVKGSRSLAPAPSKEDTLSRVEGERELKTRLDLFDTFSFPSAETGSSRPDESVLWGR